MIRNTVYKNINDILKKYGHPVTLVIRIDNNIMEKLNYEEVRKHMKEEYGEIIDKKSINQILLKIIRGQIVDYHNNTNFGVISKIFEHNITHYFLSNWTSIKFVGKNKLKDNSGVQYDLEDINFKLVNAPLIVGVEQLPEEDSFWD